MSCLRLPRTSPHVSLKQSSYRLSIHYLSLSFSWKWAKSLCFLCMLATDLQGNRCRRLQCTTPYVITALIKTIAAAYSFYSYGVVHWQLFNLLPSGCTFLLISLEFVRQAVLLFHSIHANEACSVYVYEAACMYMCVCTLAPG